MTGKKIAIVCAPMAAVTHAAFRCIVERFPGCDEHYSEMINAGTFVNGGPYEKYYAIADPCPQKIVWQITGSKIKHLASAAEALAALPGIGIDMNMGCSAPDILRSGAGAAWLEKDPREIVELLRALRAAAGGKRLSVKMRLCAEDPSLEKLFALARMMAEEGVSRIALHPRAAGEKYRQKARWERVQALAERLDGKVSVALNGDVDSAEQLEAALAAAPGVDAVMVARGAAKKPWIFAELKSFLEGRPLSLEIDREKIATDFIWLLKKYQPKDFWLTRIRRFFGFYCSTFSFAHYFETQMARARDLDDAAERARDYFVRQPSDKILRVEKAANHSSVTLKSTDRSTE